MSVLIRALEHYAAHLEAENAQLRQAPPASIVEATVERVAREAMGLDGREWLTGDALEAYRATLTKATKLESRTHSYHGRLLPRRGDDISYERGNRCGHCRVSPSDCLALPECDYLDNGRPNWAAINGRGISA